MTSSGLYEPDARKSYDIEEDGMIPALQIETVMTLGCARKHKRNGTETRGCNEAAMRRNSVERGSSDGLKLLLKIANALRATSA